ncbi:AAA family ATPase [Corallococcus macrosporus]|uniref:AAA family ATPase n=1 Tax=Corallococcus macrosporus TaxID=35 RepID=UPI0009E302AC|nr:ATP-binding protein [Corallococcus macrosporus]
MIEKVQFRNFKAYRSLDLELEPFTVLVGPNASGKTTLLEGLSLLSTIASNLLGEDWNHWPGPFVQSHGAQSPVEIGASGEWGGTNGSVRAVSPAVRIPHGPPYLPFVLNGSVADKPFKVGRENIGLSPRASSSENAPRVGGVHGNVERWLLNHLRAELSATSILRFVPKVLAMASYSDEVVPSLAPDGSGLSSVLAYFKLSQDEVFSEIEQALKQIVPAVRRIRIERAAVEQTAVRTIALDDQRHEVPEKRTLWGNQVVFDMKGAKGVAPDSAGEGTLMVLGLLTALMGPSKPRLVLLDDIELSLHPAAQARLIAALRAIQKRDPQLQIIATSHSPFILNDLDPKEVRMTFLADNGFARCEKLTAHPEFEKWKGLMAPGEFWSSVGEDWIGKLGGTAPNE